MGGARRNLTKFLSSCLKVVPRPSEDFLVSFWTGEKPYMCIGSKWRIYASIGLKGLRCARGRPISNSSKSVVDWTIHEIDSRNAIYRSGGLALVSPFCRSVDTGMILRAGACNQSLSTRWQLRPETSFWKWVAQAYLSALASWMDLVKKYPHIRSTWWHHRIELLPYMCPIH